MEGNHIVEEDIIKGKHLQAYLNKPCIEEEEYWRLKSRILWLNGGDRNTSIFHKQTQFKKQKNTIYTINNGAWERIQDF